ncbi:MAG: signal recognition particle-docking protein FtsY [Actinomycetota bacterium]|nr:signal recognition particle-docking protein FtsY [Actinomycetota bacterium]
MSEALARDSIQIEEVSSMEPGVVDLPSSGSEVEENGDSESLKDGLSKSRRMLLLPFGRVHKISSVDPEFWLEAEEALIAADAGVECALSIVEGAKKRIKAQGAFEIENLKQAFRDEVVELLKEIEKTPEEQGEKPRVLFVVGVNGVGKTTTAAKIGYMKKRQGEKVIFAAADTFRAAGIEQMEMWAMRVGAPVVKHQAGGDPAAVVFDAVKSAKAKGIDLVIVDTAGRLHTKKNLMDELSKMWRVAERQGVSAQGVLVIDATTGQNGINQARMFSSALDISSIALTKMDGSAKGGVVLAIGRELGIPVSYVGIGEGLSDLKPFEPEEYSRALF